MTSLLDIYVQKKHPQFNTMPEEQKEITRNFFLKKNYYFRHRAEYAQSGYTHFKHIFGTYSGNIFTVTANNSFSLRHYDYRFNETACVTKIAKNELVGAQYTINLENF